MPPIRFLREGAGWDLRVCPAAPTASGNLEMLGPTNQNNLKIQSRSAQNVGKVWVSRKKILLAPFGAIWAYFLRGPKKSKITKKMLIFLGGPMGPIHPVWALPTSCVWVKSGPAVSVMKPLCKHHGMEVALPHLGWIAARAPNR